MADDIKACFHGFGERFEHHLSADARGRLYYGRDGSSDRDGSIITDGVSAVINGGERQEKVSPRTQSHPSSRHLPPCWRDTRCPRSIPDPSCAESDSCREQSHDLINISFNSIIHQTPQKQTLIFTTVTICQLYHETHQ